jgi:hypothetical protein
MDPTCSLNSTSAFCVAVDSDRKCRYSFRPANAVCNGTLGLGTCLGNAASCVVDTTRTSPDVCAQDKTQLCSIPNICNATHGCVCNAARRSLSEGCICAERLGFVPITMPESGQSRCRWNVTFLGTRFVSVPLDSRVVLPVSLRINGGTMCPTGGRRVIRNVEIFEKTVCRPQPPVPLATTAEPLGESCGQFVFSTSKVNATSGSCWRARVWTTDTRQYNFIFQYQ